MRRIAVFVMLATVAQIVAAQEALPLEAGQRVRLTLDPGRSRLVGTLLAHDADSIRVQLQPDSTALVLARARVTSVDVSRGRHGHAGTGALVGLVVGGVLGAAAGADCEGDFLCPGPGAGAALVGGTGLVIGALIGVLDRTERWERVYPADIGIALPTAQHGLGVGVSVAF